MYWRYTGFNFINGYVNFELWHIIKRQEYVVAL